MAVQPPVVAASGGPRYNTLTLYIYVEVQPEARFVDEVVRTSSHGRRSTNTSRGSMKEDAGVIARRLSYVAELFLPLTDPRRKPVDVFPRRSVASRENAARTRADDLAIFPPHKGKQSGGSISPATSHVAMETAVSSAPKPTRAKWKRPPVEESLESLNTFKAIQVKRICC